MNNSIRYKFLLGLVFSIAVISGMLYGGVDNSATGDKQKSSVNADATVFVTQSVSNNMQAGDRENRDLGSVRSKKKLPAVGQLCGNGKRDGIEECDDGNTQGGDGCSNACKKES